MDNLQMHGTHLGTRRALGLHLSICSMPSLVMVSTVFGWKSPSIWSEGNTEPQSQELGKMGDYSSLKKEGRSTCTWSRDWL